MMTIDLKTAAADQLASWYVETVGYNPLEDTPDMPTEELRALCLDVQEEHANCPNPPEHEPNDGSDVVSLLQRAEAFISGFEDDEDQEGVPELLRDLRKAIQGVQVSTTSFPEGA